ncbi:MAG: hypothetical protein CR994_02370 [Maribacter sp.]|nr:MAG: hypothetical protein CR994_02370 [Maribacter sp.]
MYAKALKYLHLKKWGGCIIHTLIENHLNPTTKGYSGIPINTLVDPRVRGMPSKFFFCYSKASLGEPNPFWLSPCDRTLNRCDAIKRAR